MPSRWLPTNCAFARPSNLWYVILDPWRPVVGTRSAIESTGPLPVPCPLSVMRAHSPRPPALTASNTQSCARAPVAIRTARPTQSFGMAFGFFIRSFTAYEVGAYAGTTRRSGLGTRSMSSHELRGARIQKSSSAPASTSVSPTAGAIGLHAENFPTMANARLSHVEPFSICAIQAGWVTLISSVAAGRLPALVAVAFTEEMKPRANFFCQALSIVSSNDTAAANRPSSEASSSNWIAKLSFAGGAPESG